MRKSLLKSGKRWAVRYWRRTEERFLMIGVKKTSLLWGKLK